MGHLSAQLGPRRIGAFMKSRNPSVLYLVLPPGGHVCPASSSSLLRYNKLPTNSCPCLLISSTMNLWCRYKRPQASHTPHPLHSSIGSLASPGRDSPHREASLRRRCHRRREEERRTSLRVLHCQKGSRQQAKECRPSSPRAFKASPGWSWC
jgi:hypothetical protein